ncbi:MAG: hypothetical protein ABEI75_02320 [Halobaculum sp.]
MDRRHLLGSVVGLLAGCLDTTNEPPTDRSSRVGQSQRTTQSSHTGQSQRTTQSSHTGQRSPTATDRKSPTTQLETVAVNARVPSDCTVSRPVPEADATPYPSYPTPLDRRAAARFAWSFAEAYQWNLFLTRTDPRRVGSLRVESGLQRRFATTDGFVFGVETELVATPGTVTDTTATPHPYTRLTRAAWYVCTDRGALRTPHPRDAPDIDTARPPSPADWVVVACADS